MEKKICDLEENRKLQKDLIEKLQKKVNNVEKEKENLAEELNFKEKIIHKMKSKDFKCSGCEKYSKSMDEVVRYTAKHREAALSLKDICEKQKKKIKEYESQIDLYENDVTENEETIKQLEEDVDIGFNMNKRKAEELEKLNKEIVNYKQKEVDMNDVVQKLQKKKEISDNIIESLQQDKKILEEEIKEMKQNKQMPLKSPKRIEDEEDKDYVPKQVFEETLADCEMKLEFYRKREKDIEEEIVSKNQEIGNLSKELDKSTSKLGTTSSSLEEELEKVEIVKKETEQISKKSKRRNNLKNTLQFMKRKVQEQKTSLKKSLYGLKLKEESSKDLCSCRGFCGITHSKHNWNKSHSEQLLSKLNSMDTNIECDLCNWEFETFSELERHMTNMHLHSVKESSIKTLSHSVSIAGCIAKRYNCSNCESKFSKQGDLKRHFKSEHKLREEKIGEV